MRNHFLRLRRIPGSTDPDFANVRLLIRGQGTDNSTSFTDLSTYARSISVFGDARIRTDVFKFDNSSMFFDGTGDYLTTPGGSAFPFSTNNFTIEAWVYPTSFLDFPNIYSQRTNGGIVLRLTTAGKLNFFRGSGLNNITGTTSLSLNTWNHVAICRQTNTVTIWVNGTQDGSGTVTADLTSATAVNVGRDPEFGFEFFKGYMDELRVTIGVARYTGSFTPPTERFPIQ